MLHALAILKIWWIEAIKARNRFVESFKPSGYVEATLIHATGPNAGKVFRTYRGSNIVTGWLSGGSPTSGRDLMRRMLIPPSFSADSLSGVPDAWVGQVVLGSGTTAETSADVAIEVDMAPPAIAPVSSVVLDPINPYVTFVCSFNESEANGTISEAGLLSGPARNDFLARKTFTPFTKTSDFTLEIRWQVRF